MRDRDEDLLQADRIGAFAGLAAELDRRGPALKTDDVDVTPADPSGESGSEDFQDTLLHRPPPRQVRSRISKNRESRLLVVGVDSFDEAPGVTVVDGANSLDLDDIDADRQGFRV